MLRAVASDIISSTWANKPSSAASTGLYLFTDVGSSGTLMRYANSRWRPLAGQAQLTSLGAAVTGVANSETIVLQTLIPAGAWQTNDTVRFWLSINKSGTTDTLVGVFRVGTAGTTADTAVLGGITMLTAAQQAGGFIFDFKLSNATTVQSVGTPGSAAAYIGASATATLTPVTVSDASANALYFSFSIRSNGTTNTVGINSGQIQLITP